MAAAAWSTPVRVRDVLVAAVPELRERMLEDAIRKDWRRVVGAEFARHSQPSGLRTGALDVTVDNSPLLHEMTLRSGELLAALQARHGPTLTSMRFMLGRVAPAAAAATPRRPPPVPPRLGAEESHLVEALTATVADPALADSLRRLLTKDLLSRRPAGPSRRPDAPPSPLREDS
ncbi:MAG TPA: DUF721 domain-containing protein [Methylomirabilota bacterium]|jgi:hypothetical protein|nr:DUF721 domain-containing protein [Methylomirabilota bacterium]